MRVLIFDLLAERAEFGHGGNVEMVTPLAQQSTRLEVLLLTPQYQSAESFERARCADVALSAVESDLPAWDDAFQFQSDCLESISGCEVTFRRVLCPSGGVEELRGWLSRQRLDALYCSGSRRNVSSWEAWMEHAETMLLAAHLVEIPLLAICFGHQLLCQAFGGRVHREERRTDAVHDLVLTEVGITDPLFEGLVNDGCMPVVLFTHQDHVSRLDEDGGELVLLASAPHNRHVAVRALDADGGLSTSWGVQFHPEASRARIERSLSLGHITRQDLEAFNREHDGERILANFASVVLSSCGVRADA